MERRHRPWWTSRFFLVLAALSLIIGLVLMGLNLYGLTQPIRKPGLGVTDVDQLRFVPEQVWSFQDSMAAIDGLEHAVSSQALARQANQVVNRSLVHIDWNRVDPVEYRQLVPVWENFFLHALGRYSGLPQFERYHYADYKRGILRGIGICGDASTVLSSVLDRYGIENRIISFNGHVIVEYETGEGLRELLDPDFGVELGVPLSRLAESGPLVRSRYRQAGYREREINTLMRAYGTRYAIFDDTYHFMSKRYLFERGSYVAKWFIPALLILFGILILYFIQRSTRSGRTEKRRVGS